MILISGNESERLVDGTTDHCTKVPQSTDGVIVQYELYVNSTCGNGNDVTVRLTLDQDTDCYDLVSVLSMRELDNECSRNSMKMKRCSLMESDVDSGRKYVDWGVNVLNQQILAYFRFTQEVWFQILLR